MVIIVGNGDIRNKGKEIDSFDTVIRINNAIFNLNDDVGWKIDVWSTRYRHDYRTGLPMEFPSVRKEIESIFPAVAVWVYNNGYEYSDFREQAAKIYNLFPTTGLLTLLNTLMIFGPPVYATGFDFLDKDKPHHYWDRKEVSESAIGRHNMEREKEIFNEFADKEELIWLR